MIKVSCVYKSEKGSNQEIKSLIKREAQRKWSNEKWAGKPSRMPNAMPAKRY